MRRIRISGLVVTYDYNVSIASIIHKSIYNQRAINISLTVSYFSSVFESFSPPNIFSFAAYTIITIEKPITSILEREKSENARFPSYSGPHNK